MIQGRFDSAVPPFSSSHPCGKALQSIIVFCHRWKVIETLVPLDRWESEEEEQHGLDIRLALTNPEEAFK